MSAPTYIELAAAIEEQKKLADFITANEVSPCFPMHFLEIMENENARLLARIGELEKDAEMPAESFRRYN